MGEGGATTLLGTPPPHSRIVAGVASISSMLVSGTLSSVRPRREPMSSAGG